MDKGFDFIVLPLTMSDFGSFHIPALIRDKRAGARTILFSGTTATRSTLEKVFDASISTTDPLMGFRLDAVFRNAPPRSRVISMTKSELGTAIGEILEAAPIFANEYWQGIRSLAL